MRRVVAVILIALAGVALWGVAVFAHRGAAPSVTIYDPNPSHLWDRLYAALLVRQDNHQHDVGEDALDPPLWMETEHLLSQPSHQLAVGVLDEFLRDHGETLIRDPLKRAMLQRDLWAVFDWSVTQDSVNERPKYEKEKQELQVRLAAVLRRLALTPDEIKSLPDTYAQAVASNAFAKKFDAAHPDQPFLPPDLFDPHGGPWVCIEPSPESESGVARMHIENLSGRSSFFVFVRLPEGRKATYDYFRTLWNFSPAYIAGPSSAADQAPPNPDLPSFPTGTEVALVRRVMLIDNQGNLAGSPLTESVQIRVYRAITSAEERNFGNGNVGQIIKNSGQHFYELKLSRPLLFSGRNGGLRAIGRDEIELPTFQTKGDDLVDELGEQAHQRNGMLPELQTCVWCHNGGGVNSLNSRASLLKPNRLQQEPQNANYGPIYWGESAGTAWKQNRYDWGLLNGYWKASSPPQ